MHSAKEVARMFGTDARTIRKFLRDITAREDQPGQGKRWLVKENKKSMQELRDQFEEWNRPKVEEEPETDQEGPEGWDGTDTPDNEVSSSLGMAMAKGLLQEMVEDGDIDPDDIDLDDIDLDDLDDLDGPSDEELAELE